MNEVTYRARWIFPVAQPPIEGGSITLSGDRILSVDRAEAREVDVDLGNISLLPGFTNAHTHLDLSGASGQCPPSSDFTAWIRKVIAFRRHQTPEKIREAIEEGASACLKAGTTLVGDIASGGASWDILAQMPMRAVIYYELLGLTRERAEQSWSEAQAWLDLRQTNTTCHVGLTPHAPYSVRVDLMERVAELAASAKIPVAIHLGESPEELELLISRTGPFVEFLKEVNAWDPDGLCTDPSNIFRIFREVPCMAYVHGCFLEMYASELRRSQNLVICPRTSLAFGREIPWRYDIAAGLGTDSLASNPDLNILEEARTVYRSLSPTSGPGVLHQLTLGGAKILGWDQETGSLEPGKSAELVVLPISERHVDDPHRLLFDSDLNVRGVMFRGHWVVGENAPASDQRWN